jgi:hypothetical protein
MYPVDPKMLIQMIRQGQNPQQLMISILQGQAYNNPLGKNLLNLAQSGQINELEKVVRNIYAQQGGKNFDQDFEAFKRAIGYNT